MTFVNTRNAPLWFLGILISTILFRQLGFSLLSEVAIGLHTSVFLLFSLVVGNYYSKSKTIARSDVLVILGTAFCSLFLLWDIISLAALTVLLLFLISSTTKYKGNKALRIAVDCFSILTVMVCFIVLVFSVLLDDFGTPRVLHTLPSPNGKFLLSLEEHDAGATGGNTVVSVTRSFGEIIQWKRRLYIGRWSDEPALQWIDNHTVKINGTDCSIFFGDIDSRL